jgi:phage virion morphogenesis protein
MALISVDTTQLTAATKALLSKLRVRTPLMRKIAADMHDAVEENFAQGGRPPWAALAPSTIRARTRKRHWPGQVLVVTGLLRNSISESSDNDQALVGTNVPYAAIQQYGGTITRYPQSRIDRQTFTRTKSGQVRFAKAKGAFSTLMRTTIGQHSIHIPARPFLRLVDQDVKTINDTIVQHLQLESK